MTADPDPRGVIAEAFRMSDLGEAECRSIFLDWVLGLPDEADVAGRARALLARHEAPADHPMTPVLQSASSDAGPPRRRGGRRRISGEELRPRTRGR